MTSRPPTVGVLAGWLAYEEGAPDRFMGVLLQGIHAAAEREGCDLVVGCGVGRIDGLADLHSAWPAFSVEEDFVPVGPDTVDGLIVIPPFGTAARQAWTDDLKRRGFPLVLLGPYPDVDHVAIDGRAGVLMALEHLRDHGHRRIAFLKGRSDDAGDSRERLEAYREGVETLGLERDESLVGDGMHSWPGGYRAMHELLDSGASFTAVLAGNDVSAAGANQALRERGMAVPREVAVIGFDDQPLAEAQVPALTSVGFPLVEIGARLLRAALRRIEDPAAPPHGERIVPSLQLRHSCGCLGGDRDHCHDPTPEAHPLLRSATDAQLAEFEREAAATFTELVRAPADAGSEPDAALRDLMVRMDEIDADAQDLQDLLDRVRDEALAEAATARGAAADVSDARLGRVRTVLAESTRRRERRRGFELSFHSSRVARIGVLLHAAHDEAEIARTLVRRAPEVGIRRAFLTTFDDPSGMQPEGREHRSTLHLPRGGRIERIPFATERPPLELLGDGSVRWTIVPVVAGDEQYGCMLFDADDVRSCGILARQIGVALQRIRLYAQVLALSTQDGLTGVYNRRHFDVRLAAEFERSARYRRPLSLLMVDVDRFKPFNDDFGHQAGDEALRRVAETLATGVRATDLVARYGGEEFAILLTETSLEEAWTVAEKLRRRIAAIEGLPRDLTASLGIAATENGAGTPDTLVQRADRALYEAKDRGRDRTCCDGAPLGGSVPAER